MTAKNTISWCLEFSSPGQYACACVGKHNSAILEGDTTLQGGDMASKTANYIPSGSAKNSLSIVYIMRQYVAYLSHYNLLKNKYFSRGVG